MRQLALFALLGIMVSWCSLHGQNKKSHVKGVVSSEQGTPIAGVTIYAWHDATTDDEGKFDIPDQPDKNVVIYFDKDGFRSKTMVVRPDESTLRVVLDDDAETAWTLPMCPATEPLTFPPGALVRFSVPNDIKVRKLQDADYQEYVLTVSRSSKPLELWWGAKVSPAGIVERLILDSVGFEERSVRRPSGERIGEDRKGSTSDGMRWRAADFPGASGSAIYDGVPAEVAARYDRVIDSACVLVPPLR